VDTIVTQGLELMLFGMGTVFTFLTLLVIGTTFMSKIINSVFPEAEVEVPAPRPSANSAAAVDARTISIIEDAVRQHRARQ
jgi:oxaloacetate decarboxylase gamma subunit